MIRSIWRGPLKAWTAQLRGNPLTNVRSETVATASTFHDAYAARRCLVPATNYFEWTADPERPKGKKADGRFNVPDQETVAFPGSWDHAETARADRQLHTADERAGGTRPSITTATR
jgi:putative SOS response-associated peptidase YedK